MRQKNYIRYPVKISTLLPKVLKPLRRNNDGVLLEIKLNWDKIVDPKISSICFVYSLKKINNKTILTIVSDNRNIVELSYSSEEIKNNVNDFFDASIVNEIKFKKSLKL